MKANSKHFMSDATCYFIAFFIYYAGYCLFSSYAVSFLTARGHSATFCGFFMSGMLILNLLLQPIGGYITDTYITAKKYLLGLLMLIIGLCITATIFYDNRAVYPITMLISAGIAYSMSQLMDAWVNIRGMEDKSVVYSRIRAGGSIGFSITSALIGLFFHAYGWKCYFLIQAVFFLLMIPFLMKLPENPLENRKKSEKQTDNKEWLSGRRALEVMFKNVPYLVCLLLCTMYWFSHRPVGSYFALITSDRGGTDADYGYIIALGSAVEFLCLMGLGRYLAKTRAEQESTGETEKKSSRKTLGPYQLLFAALITDMIRPALFLLPGINTLYIGQICQSVSFAFFLSANVECFTRVSDRRIRSMSIAFGLTVSSVLGTTLANLLGGSLYDMFGSGAMIRLSLGLAILNLIFIFVFGKKMQLA